jgi:DNA polymerase II small subunit/DNA polymerase delta subunit B
VGWTDDDDANSFTLFDRSADARFGLLNGNTFEPYVALFESNEEIRRLETRSRELAAQVRRADASEKAELTRELTAVLNEIFDLKLQSQQERVERISGELEELRSRIQERSNARSQIIERRVRELTGERDALAW